MTQVIKGKGFTVRNKIIDGPRRADLIHAFLSNIYDDSNRRQTVNFEIDDCDSGDLCGVVITGLDVDRDSVRFRGYCIHPMWHLKPTAVHVVGGYSTKSNKGWVRIRSLEV